MNDFTHADLGTPEQAWLDSPHGQHLPELDLPTDDVVVLAAHPDDETLGAGGLMATLRAAGVQVRVLVATLGEASHPHSPTTTREQLAARRRREVTEAVVALTGREPTFLDLPDGQLSQHYGRLVGHLRDACGPDTTLVAPWRHDGHTDHDTCGHAAAQVAREDRLRLLEYPIWWWHWGSPEEPWPACGAVLRLDGRAVEEKSAAMTAHTSQVSALSDQPGDEVLLGEHVLAHFRRDHEFFLDSWPGTRGRVADLMEQVHRREPDPWGADKHWYEERKRAVLLASLPRRRYRRGLEVGCSTGRLTLDLTDRVDELVARDASPEAVRAARQRLVGRAVDVQVAHLPAQWPDGDFDLVVLSETGYYLSSEELDEFVERCAAVLPTDGALVACHWMGPIEDWELDGRTVHERLVGSAGLEVLASHREEDFWLDVLVPSPATSVARAEGLV